MQTNKINAAFPWRLNGNGKNAKTLREKFVEKHPTHQTSIDFKKKLDLKRSSTASSPIPLPKPPKKT